MKVRTNRSLAVLCAALLSVPSAFATGKKQQPGEAEPTPGAMQTGEKMSKKESKKESKKHAKKHKQGRSQAGGQAGQDKSMGY